MLLWPLEYQIYQQMRVVYVLILADSSYFLLASLISLKVRLYYKTVTRGFGVLGFWGF
jgi:hypothetical protein